MNNSRVFRHEDNSEGAKVFYSIFLSGLNESKPSLNFNIEKMQNEIYHDSKREKVLVPPNQIKLCFTAQETMRIMGLFVEATSLYMAAIRKKLYFSNTLRLEMEPRDSKYKIIFHAVNKKVSGAGREKNSARLIMSFIDEETQEEVLAIKLKKTKIIILMQIIKSLYEEYVQKFSFSYDDIEGRRMSLVRVGDTVAIGSVWIHGREIQKFQDFIERIIYDFKFHIGNGREMFSYRQVSAGFSFADNVAQINLIKYTDKHKVYLDENKNTVQHSFIVNSEAAALFYLILPKAIEFNLGDVEVFTSGQLQNLSKKKIIDAESEEEVENSEFISIMDRQQTSSIKSGDFILNMIETQLVLQVNKKRKFNAKNRVGKLSLAVRYRDFIVNDDGYKVGRTNKDTGEFLNVQKLSKCVIDLNIDWLYIFALCAESVHSSKDLALNEFGNYTHSWRFKEMSMMGGNQYGLRVVTDPGNKVPAVILIDYHVDDFGEIGDGPLPSTGGARMRIPLFKEHVRTLLKGLVGLSSQFENYYWMKNFPVYSDTCDEVTGEMTLGIRRFYNKNKKEEVVSFGVVGKSTEQIYLTNNDRDTLFFSAYYRLMYGRWLQFAGEQISVSADGWITDRYNEYRIEFDLEASSGARGSLPALAILFATARAKNMKPVEKTTKEGLSL